MNKSVSIYLDLVRFLAALMVVFAHFNALVFGRELPGFIFNHGREAVAVFFVLSGFVIRHIQKSREPNFRSFTVARLARLYSVVLLAVVVTVLADFVGNLNAEYRQSMNFAVFYDPVSVKSVISNLTFTNELWGSHLILGANEPFWSLGYEAMYYVLFAVITFSSGKLRWFGMTIWLMIVGPFVAMYFPLWYLGCLTYDKLSTSKEYGVDKFFAKYSFYIFLATIFVYFFVRHTIGKHASNMYSSWSLASNLVNFLYFLLLGLIASVNILAVSHMSNKRLDILFRYEKYIRWLAGSTFTLYLMHQPLLVVMKYILPSEVLYMNRGVLIFVLTIFFVFILAELGERRKSLFFRFFEKFLPSKI